MLSFQFNHTKGAQSNKQIVFGLPVFQGKVNEGDLIHFPHALVVKMNVNHRYENIIFMVCVYTAGNHNHSQTAGF